MVTLLSIIAYHKKLFKELTNKKSSRNSSNTEIATTSIFEIISLQPVYLYSRVVNIFFFKLEFGVQKVNDWL